MVYLAISKLEGQCRPQPAQADMIGKERERESAREREGHLQVTDAYILYYNVYYLQNSHIS